MIDKLNMSFTDFYNENKDYLFNFLSKMNKELDIEGIVDEAFAIFYSNLDNYDPSKSKPQTYLFNIAKNLLLALIKKERIDYYHYDAYRYVIEYEDDSEEYDHSIDERFAKLVEDVSDDVVISNWISGKSYKEIVEISGFTLSKVKNQIHQFKKRNGGEKFVTRLGNWSQYGYTKRKWAQEHRERMKKE
jgi:RNA polymerase sigma factor (sigma-70 family)